MEHARSKKSEGGTPSGKNMPTVVGGIIMGNDGSPAKSPERGTTTSESYKRQIPKPCSGE